MLNQPLVSIIIASFNEESNITKCLESLLGQSYKKNEIIVIDDGSTDKTQQLVSQLQNQHKQIRLLKQNHQGPAIARNLGAGEAKGKILSFLDADMTFSKNFIKELVQPIIKGQAKGTFSKEERVANWKNIWAKNWNVNLGLPKDRMLPKAEDFRAILKTEFERVKGFDDTGYTDTWTLAKKLGYKPQAAPGAVYYHYNPDSLKEFFAQAKWRAKRKYKLGLIGLIIALVRVSPPVSLLTGLTKSIYKKEPGFLVFKLIYDLAAITGILEMVVFKKLAK